MHIIELNCFVVSEQSEIIVLVMCKVEVKGLKRMTEKVKREANSGVVSGKSLIEVELSKTSVSEIEQEKSIKTYRTP